MELNLHQDSQQALTQIRELQKERGFKKMVFISGNFNVIHPGHQRVLRFAASCGDFLVVGVYCDKTGMTILPEQYRWEGVRDIGSVDHAFILRDPPEDFISELQPAIVVKGKEHEKKFNPEEAALKEYGGKLLFGSGEVSFSSIELLRKQFNELNFSSINKPREFLQHHGFSMNDLRETVGRMKSLRICVFGDTIIDEYITCDPLGMSREDPTIVVTPVLEEKFVGGAAIVAAHAAGLGAEVRFFSVTGSDASADYLRESLEKYGVHGHLVEDESRPTTLKQRYRAKDKALLRVSHLRQHDVGTELQAKMFEEFKATPRPDLVIFSDFNYGCLPQELVSNIVEHCNREGIMMVADSQSSSQVGDVSRFPGMRLLTPTEHEARLAVRDSNSGIVVLAESLRKKSTAENVIMTLGAEGVLIHAGNGENDWITDRLPAFNSAPRDISGAGDSLLTCASMAMALGEDIWRSTYLGSLAAACQVGRVGNTPLSAREIIKEINI